jgi:hypothetical protein
LSYAFIGALQSLLYHYVPVLSVVVLLEIGVINFNHFQVEKKHIENSRKDSEEIYRKI